MSDDENQHRAVARPGPGRAACEDARIIAERLIELARAREVARNFVEPDARFIDKVSSSHFGSVRQVTAVFNYHVGKFAMAHGDLYAELVEPLL